MNNNRISLEEIGAYLGGPSVTLVHYGSYIGTLFFIHQLQVFGPIIYKEKAN